MKRSRKIGCGLALLALLAAGACWYYLSRDGKTVVAGPAEEYQYKPLKTISAHLAMLEKPDACRVLVLGETGEDFRPFFEHAKLKCLAKDEAGRYDIVFVGGKPDRAWADIVARVGTSGVLAWTINVSGTSAAEFKAMLEAFPCEQTHLWMPGENEWLLVGRVKPARLKLDAMLELFSDDDAFIDLVRAQCESLPELFASYVGNRDDILPAFVGDLSMPVRPEFFVTRDIKELDWVSKGDVDDDIFATIRSEIRSMQFVRRMILEGNMLARTPEGMDAALDKWSAAVIRNPRDPMMMDRLYRLAVNAKAFQNVGNLKGAAKCYETMISIRPKDAAALAAYADCMKALGQKEISEQAAKKAEELLK